MELPASRREELASELATELHSHPRYRWVSFIKSGSFGHVALAEDAVTQRKVALKFIPRCQVGNNSFTENEVLNQHKLQHPHIVSLNEVFLTEQHLVLVLEYAQGGDLASWLPRSGMPENEARWIFLQVLFALDFCHRMGVASRDVKLENVLLEGGNKAGWPIAKLCDFGLSQDCSKPGSSSPVGTPAYLAPEVLRHSMTGNAAYDAKRADMWSCGVLLHALLTGKSAFQRSSDAHLSTNERLHLLFQRILTRDFQLPASLSEEGKDFLSSMLATDPAARPTASELLAHPWCSAQLSGSTMLQFNDVLVERTLRHPTSPEVLHEVYSILEEARINPTTPRGLSNLARMAGSGSSAGAAPSAHTSYVL